MFTEGFWRLLSRRESHPFSYQVKLRLIGKGRVAASHISESRAEDDVEMGFTSLERELIAHGVDVFIDCLKLSPLLTNL